MLHFIRLVSITLCLAFSFAFGLRAQKISTRKLDKIIDNAIKTFDVPGMAVAIVKDGKIIHSKGYGVCSINSINKVDENTLFGIASNSKAFTTAALATLVDRNILSLDDKVRDYIPEFKMYNPYVTEEFTIRDLLTHRSGLGLGAGDLMIFPHVNDFTVDDIIHNIRFLKPVSGFRTKYDYDNLLYVVAGEVVRRVSGMSWIDYIETKILTPLQMKRSAPSFLSLKDTSNIATPHIPINGKLKTSSRCYSDVLNAAGGIYSSVADMSKWMIVQLNAGSLDGVKIYSEKMSKEMWKPQTLKNVWSMPYYKSNFRAYALGWEVGDLNGLLEVSHTGGLPGMVTQVTMIPELNVGIVVLTNQQSGFAFMAVTDAIKDMLLGINHVDRVKLYKSFQDSRSEINNSITSSIWKYIDLNNSSLNTDEFEGYYLDKWWGSVAIIRDNEKLLFQSVRSPLMRGELFHYKANTFVVKWENRSFNADAFVMFDLNESGRAQSFKMKAISPETDFSFDFQDLDFSRK